MTRFLTRTITIVLLVSLASPALAQSVIDSYTAQIAPEDRRNSSGVALTDTRAILAQDRANVHRFGNRQPGDSIDATFTNRRLRASLPDLLSRGSISPAAQAAIRSGGLALLQITVWGDGGTPNYVTVELAPTVDSADVMLTARELAPSAARIQAALNARGFNAGPVDGQPGRQTRNAITAFQGTLGKPQTGVLTQSEFAALTGSQPPAQDPSIDCARAGTPSELAICSNNDLAALNRELSAVWSAARDSAESDSLTTEQRQWLGTRNACGANADCLTASMRGRISTLSQIAGLTLAPVVPASSTSTVASTASAATISSDPDGLIYVDDRLLWNTGPWSRLLAMPQGDKALQIHAVELARRLEFTVWDFAYDDLESGLKALASTNNLRDIYNLLPSEAQVEVVTLGLDLSPGSERDKDYCRRQQPPTQFSCATQRFSNEFDRRRFQQGFARIIAREISAGKLPLPMEVQVFCTMGAIDRAYDFDTNMVNWAAMLRDGSCGAPNTMLTHSRAAKMQTTLDIANAMPDSSQMDPDRVEALARSYQSSNAQGQPQNTPLFIAFTGQITAERTSTDKNPLGMFEVSLMLRRTGPVDLRSATAPTKTIMMFDAPSDSLNPTDAVDLSLAENAYALVENAPAFDAAALSAALANGAEPSMMVRLKAHHLQDATGTTRLSAANFFDTGKPAQRIAVATGVPLEHVARARLSAQSRVPNIDLVLIFPAPLVALVSDPVNVASGQSVSLIASISPPMQVQGVAGPALVAVAKPRFYEVQEAGIGGTSRVVARPPVAQVMVDDLPQIFLPSALWFVTQGAQLQGIDLDAHLDAVLGRANMVSGDTFARLDAIASVRERLAAQPAQSDDPWIAGGIEFGPYDLDRKAWRIRKLTPKLPTGDQLEARIARRVQPNIQPQQLHLPMEVEAARAFQDVLNQNRPLEFYARVDISPPTSAGDLSVTATLREVLVYQADRPRSRSMQLSPRLDRGEAIAAINLPAATESSTPATDTASTPQPAPTPTPVEQIPVAPVPESQPAWPTAVPNIEMTQSAWDLLGLRTGMTVSEAEALILGRGGVLAAFERPFMDLDPSFAMALRYQRLYISSGGTEAITLAAPAPDGPVLAILRRLQLPRGELPFENVKDSIVQKYGAPNAEHPEGEVMARAHWFSDTAGALATTCSAQFVVRGSLRRWLQVDGIGTRGFDLNTQPAPWDWQINDAPVDYITQLADCGQVLTYIPESAAQTSGGAAFTMMMTDARALRTMDEALAGVPETGTMEIDF